MEENLPRDPVCGLEIHPDDVDSWVEYGGTQYYFCCPSCQRTFEESPEAYAGGQQKEAQGHHKEDGSERHDKHQGRI